MLVEGGGDIVNKKLPHHYFNSLYGHRVKYELMYVSLPPPRCNYSQAVKTYMEVADMELLRSYS